MSKNVELGGTTYNGVETVKLPLAGADGYAEFVDQNLQTKTATENGEVTPDAGYTGLSKVTVNVSGGGSTLKEASGTISALEADAYYIKVNNLEFTPKAFRLAWGETPVQNSTAGGFYVKGFSGIYRTGTNNTTITSPFSQNATVTPTDFTVEADSLTPSAGSGCHILEHGFAVAANSSNFPFRAGQSFTWYAVG